MSYLALYRKFRPQVFDDVIGQTHITKTLINQIESNQVGHAYLFCGSRGTGKTTTARIFARAINCEHPVNGSPCGKCPTCKALESQQNMDIIEIDAASNNGVDDARDLREKVKYAPMFGKKKVFIIDEVHMLSQSAFNALLKTLEEPPEHVVFIFGTTEINKLPATILSRLMRFDFRLLSVSEIQSLLIKIFKESKVKYEESAVNIIARSAEGSVRDALSLADACISYCNGNVTHDAVVEALGSVQAEEMYDIADGIIKNDIGKTLIGLDNMITSGKRPITISKEIVAYFRDLLVLNTAPRHAKQLVMETEEVISKMKDLAKSEYYDIIVSTIFELSAVEADLRSSAQPRMVLETAIIRISNNTTLNERVSKLEKGLIVSEPQPKPVQISKQESKPSTKDSTPVPTTEAEIVLGELMKHLKENQCMTLMSACQDIDDFEIKGSNATIFTKTDITVETMQKPKNLTELNKFFDSKGFKLSVQKRETRSKSSIDLKMLKTIIGKKLIEED